MTATGFGAVSPVWIIRMRILSVSLIALLLSAIHAFGQPDRRPAIAEVMVQLQARYAALGDFSADFAHTYAGGVLSVTDTEYGTVHVKKPGRWRFDYTDPEPKLFVCDGALIHSYFPADRQVIVSQLPTDGGASTPALFLAGVGDLQRDFTAEFAEPPDPTDQAWIVRLTPIRNDADYEHLTLTLDPDSLAIRQMATTDFQGGVSTYTFSNLKENRGLSDTFFAFAVPPGVEVLTDDSFTR